MTHKLYHCAVCIQSGSVKLHMKYTDKMHM